MIKKVFWFSFLLQQRRSLFFSPVALLLLWAYGSNQSEIPQGYTLGRRNRTSGVVFTCFTCLLPFYTQHGIMGFRGGTWDSRFGIIRRNRSDWMVGTLLGLAFGWIASYSFVFPVFPFGKEMGGVLLEGKICQQLCTGSDRIEIERHKTSRVYWTWTDFFFFEIEHEPPNCLAIWIRQWPSSKLNIIAPSCTCFFLLVTKLPSEDPHSSMRRAKSGTER